MGLYVIGYLLSVIGYRVAVIGFLATNNRERTTSNPCCRPASMPLFL